MRRVLPLLAVVAAGGLLFAAAAFPAARTTTPGTNIVIGVVLSDQSVNVFEGAKAPRGSIITFLISNRGKRLHNFAVLGKKTPLIKPNHTAKLVVNLLARGAFPYRSTVDKGPRFRGHFIIY
jgi:hypothetical protein